MFARFLTHVRKKSCVEQTNRVRYLKTMSTINAQKAAEDGQIKS